MFGHEKKILAEGAQTQGVVDSVYKQMWGNTGTVSNYQIELQVRFDDGSTHKLFVDKLRQKDLQVSDAEWYAIDDKIVDGAVVPLRYDATDREKMVVDFPAFGDALRAAVAPQVARAEAASNDAIARGEAQIAGGTASASAPAPVAGADAPAAQTVDIADELSKLAGLRDQGVLTDEEFGAQKRKLLGS